MQNKWVIIGCGGHARSIADVILDNDQYADIVFLDKNAKNNEKLFGFPIIAVFIPSLINFPLSKLFSSISNLFCTLSNMLDIWQFVTSSTSYSG